MPATIATSAQNTRHSLLVREAKASDDAQICAQIRRNAMPGSISLAMSHEPSFFESVDVEGYAQRVVVGEHDGQIVGVGLTSKRLVYLNGEATELGYLSSLRVDRAIRNTTALVRGFRLFRQWHDEDPSTPFYICSILKDNVLARRILTSGRAGLPASHDLGTLYTAAIPFVRRPLTRSTGTRIVRGDQVGAVAIIEFLNRVGRAKQFYPVYTVDDLLAEDGMLRGLCVDDFFVALCGDRIVGTTACWNQLSFRRMLVTGYSGSMRWVKPILCQLARALKLAPLPDPGDAVRSVMTACIAIENNEPAIFKALLHSVLTDQYATGKTFLLVGLMETDPLLQVARQYLHLPTRSCICALEWSGDTALEKLDGRLPYIELGSL